ncbi:MAG: MnhB domain-containing protein, partial [Candidatus Aerophobetes bacterium]
MKENKGMTLIVKTVVKFLAPIVILFGVYIILHGHLTPGGGFPGGVVVASAFILLTLAYGKEVAEKKMKRSLA